MQQCRRHRTSFLRTLPEPTCRGPTRGKPAVSQTTLQNLRCKTSNDNQNARISGLPEGWFQPLSLIVCLPQEFTVSPLTLYLAKKLSHKDNCGRSSVFVDKIQKTKVEEFHVSQESDDAP